MPLDPIAEIKNRVYRKNKNWLAVITGETGSGKSYTSLKMAELIDPKFSIDRCVFTVEQFMALLNSGTLKRGSVIVFDEAGVGIPAREWQSISNKLIGYILQTFRHENLCVIFTVPSWDFIDIQARRLIHTYMETKTINRERKKVYVKWFNLDYSGRIGKQYFRYPLSSENGATQKVRNIWIGIPSQPLVDAYESKKKDYTVALKQKVEEGIKESKVKKEPKPKTNLEEIADKAFKLLNDDPIPTVSDLEVDHKISNNDARKLRKMLMKKRREKKESEDKKR